MRQDLADDQRIFDACKNLHRAATSTANYEKYRDGALKLVEQDPGNTGFQRDIVVSYAKLGNVFELQQNYEKALSYLQAARDQVFEMIENGTLAPEDTWILQELEQRIEILQKE